MLIFLQNVSNTNKPTLQLHDLLKVRTVQSGSFANGLNFERGGVGTGEFVLPTELPYIVN